MALLLCAAFVFAMDAAPLRAQGTAAAQQAATLEGIDAFAAEQLKEWKTPGAAIGVAHDGKVILLKGYGYRDLEKQLPVTPETLFAIGSITKSFTVTLLGMLSDENKLDWDKPVRAYLPGFALQDEVAATRMTPRDLVTHRSGLPRHDALWYGSPLTRMQMFERLRYLEPSRDFRQLYQYNNLMFMTAGILAEQIDGKSWEQQIREKIFAPLGMRLSNLSVSESQKAADFAQPYQEIKETMKKVPFRNIDAVGPAGSINSCVADMMAYAEMHLKRGKQGERQLLSAAMAGQMQAPQMVMPGEPPFAELSGSSYAMAFTVHYYRGHKVVSHGGAIDGFTALLGFLPAEKISVVILTNRSGSQVPATLSRYVFDRLLGLEVVDWTRRLKEQQARQRASEEEARKKGYTGKREGTRPSHDLKDYSGTYEHPAYGAIRVTESAGKLRAAFQAFDVPLEHFHYDTFEVPDSDTGPLDGAKVTFQTNVKGDIASLSVPLEPAVKEIVFTRKGEMPDAATLKALEGEYALGPQTVSVALKADGTLTLTLPGQPTYELVPSRGLAFDIKGRPGYSVEFKRGAGGAANEVVFFQPNGTFLARRK
jgi:CubicO group peptidase (beta-lactamase class C family)